MKSNIKSKKFYKEAENMKEGWGDYLLYIDELKDKKQNNGIFSLNQFCWTLYGDGHCSQTWLDFQSYARKSKILRRSYKNWTILFANRPNA